MQNLSFAQYNKLLTEESEWYVYHFFEGSHNHTEHLDGDTIVANTHYFKFIYTPLYGFPDYVQTALLREDTIAKQVFRLAENNEEQIIYDFNLLPGDTFYLNQAVMVLDSITDTIIYGTSDLTLDINNPKVFHFTNFDVNVNNTRPVVWVEGIGSLAGLLLVDFGWGGGNFGETLLCHYNKNGERDFHFVYDSSPNECEGYVFITSNENPKPLQQAINVYPNPAYNFIKIETEDASLKMESISFINSLGLAEKTSRINSTKFEIDISKLSKGISWLVIKLDNGLFVRKKIIILE